MTRISVYLLGYPRVECDGVTANIDRRKALALLAYLAASPGTPHSRDTLATLLWPDCDRSTARAGLRRILSALNSALGNGWSLAQRDSVSVNPHAGIWLDTGRFEQLTDLAHPHPGPRLCPDCLAAASEAVRLYRSDFLEGFSGPDTIEFEEWQFYRSEQLRARLGRTLERLVDHHGDRSELDEAIGYARRLVSLDPLHEPAHRRLMTLYARLGRHSAALTQYERCARVLRQELGADPELDTTRLLEEIKASMRRPRRPLLPAPETSPAAARNKERELAEVLNLLALPGSRLLVPVGARGVNRPMHAVESVESLPSLFPDGAYVIRVDEAATHPAA